MFYLLQIVYFMIIPLTPVLLEGLSIYIIRKLPIITIEIVVVIIAPGKIKEASLI